MYCPPCRHAGDVQAACHLPRDAIRLRREVVDLDHDQLGLRGPSLGEPDHLVADRELIDSGADLRDNPGKIAALPGRKGRGKDVSHRPGSDGRLTRVDACRFDPDEDLLSPGTGRSISSTRKTSIPPNSSYLTAFIVMLLLRRVTHG